MEYFKQKQEAGNKSANSTKSIENHWASGGLTSGAAVSCQLHRGQKWIEMPGSVWKQANGSNYKVSYRQYTDSPAIHNYTKYNISKYYNICQMRANPLAAYSRSMELTSIHSCISGHSKSVTFPLLLKFVTNDCSTTWGKSIFKGTFWGQNLQPHERMKQSSSKAVFLRIILIQH